MMLGDKTFSPLEVRSAISGTADAPGVLPLTGQVRIYNRALSASEVQALYNSGK